MTNDNKTISRRMIEEVFSKGQLAAIDQFIAPSFVPHDPAAQPGAKGPQALRQIVELYRGAFPDLRITVDDQIEERDRVVTRWTGRGTHRGPYAGHAATGKSATVTGITIDRFEAGKIVETWTSFDNASLLEQLGFLGERRTDGAGQAAAMREQRGPHY